MQLFTYFSLALTMALWGGTFIADSLIGKAILSTLSPLNSVCYSSLIGTVLLQIVAIRDGLLQSFPLLRAIDCISLSYLGVCGTALGLTLYYHAIKKIGAARASVFINLVSCLPSYSHGLSSMNQSNP